MEKYIWEIGSAIFVYLGIIHLIFTFFTNKFSSRSEMAIEVMKSSTPILTKDTSLWKAWLGFNGSHSIGAIFIGVINIYLAHFYFDLFTPFLFIFNIVIVSFYLWLAKRYWFRIPFYGILLTLVSYCTTFIITLL